MSGPRQPRSKHRVGRPFRRAKANMLASKGDLCVYCGHPGAKEADHIVPVSVDPTQPVTARGIQPAHGSNYPCPVCPGKTKGKGRACNQIRGTKPMQAMAWKPKLIW